MPEIEMVTVEEPPKPRELYHIASRVLDIPRMERVYKLQRAVVNLKAPLAAPLYHMTDMELTRFGRKVRARLYTPGKEDGGCLILFFHGGGWVTESVDSYHGGLRETGRRAGGEGHLGRVWAGAGTPVPGGAGGLFRRGGGRFSRNPAVSATAPEDIVLMGDSAGGNLAAAVSLMGRDREMFTVRRQVLLYPATYNDHSPETSPFPSIRENGEGVYPHRQAALRVLGSFTSRRTTGTTPTPPRFWRKTSPASRIPSSSPPGWTRCGTRGRAYGRRLREAGNWAEVCRMEEALHGFISRVQSPEFARACELMRGFLRRGKEDSDGKE